jgi:hypothetical protein
MFSSCCDKDSVFILRPAACLTSTLLETGLVKRGRVGGKSEIPLLALRGLSVSGMYVFIIINLLMSPLLEYRNSVWYTHKENSLIRRGVRWSSGQCARRAIAEAKHRSQWTVLGWVTKIYYLKLLRAAEGTLSRWSRLHLQSFGIRIGRRYT